MAVLGVYILFLLVGTYSGQKTFSVETFGPLDGAQLKCSPIELAARVTIRGNPVSDSTARFTLYHLGNSESFGILTGTTGMAELVLPVFSGNYTWEVAVMKTGYPKAVSGSASFSLELALIVDGLAPSPFILAISPVTFKARVSDVNGHSVASANVTFYVDSTAVGSNVTDPKGISKLSAPVAPGRHTWFASACDGQGGISQATPFLVGQAAALSSGGLGTAATSELLHLGGSHPWILTRSAPDYPPPIMRASSRALNENPRLESMT